MKVRDLMRSIPRHTTMGESLASAGRTMAEAGVGVLPVVDANHRVVAVLTDRDVCCAVARANRLDVGLGASVWSGNLDAARAVAGRIQAGTVWINQHGAIHPMVPFGGVKGSGWGVEFGIDGLKAVTQPQVMSIKK